MIVAAATGGAPVDALALLLVLVAAWGAGALATRVGYPAVLGELIAGIVLGPPLLGVLRDGAGLAAIGELGIILMMVYIGTEIDLDDLRRASRAGVLAAFGGFVVPFGGGVVLMLVAGFGGTEAVFVGAAMGVTSLAANSRILSDLQLLGTRIAYVLLAGALLSDTATLLIFAGVTSLDGEGGRLGSAATVGARAGVFFAIMLGAAAAAPRVGRWSRERLGLDGPRWGLAVLVIGGLAGAALSDVLGLHAILGAFVAGMVLRRGVLTPRTQRHASEQLERISIGVLAPVFFATAGFAISLPAAREHLGLLLAVLAVATVGKVVGTALCYLPTGHGWREGLVVGGAMNGRGAVEIIVAGIGLEQGLIGTDVFTVLVLMAIGTTAAVPVVLKVGVEWLRSRGELADVEGGRRGVTIMGAGPLAIAWASTLAEHREVWLVDANAERCRRAQALGWRVVHGNALDVEVLRRARSEDAELFLALTPNVEVNLVAASIARDEFGVRALRVAIGEDPGGHATLLVDRAGAKPVWDGPVDVERWSAWLDSGAAGLTTVVITARSSIDAVEARLATSTSALPLAVLRGDDAIPYPLVDRLRVGDRVVAVAHVTVDAVVAPA